MTNRHSTDDEKKNRYLSIRNDMEGVNHFTSDFEDNQWESKSNRLMHHLKPFDDIPKSTSELLDPLVEEGEKLGKDFIHRYVYS